MIGILATIVAACGPADATPTPTPTATTVPGSSPTSTPTPAPAPTDTLEPTPTRAPAPTPTALPAMSVGTSVPVMGASHISDDQKVAEYNSVPPTSGPHFDRPADCGSYDEELPDERVVHNLEHGQVVISYNLASTDVEKLQALWEDLPASEMWSVVRPYSKIDPGTVAMTAWGVMDLIPGVDEDQIRTFYRAYSRNRLSEETSRAGPIPCGGMTPPEMTLKDENKYIATIETNKGTIVLELFPKDAPFTVNNFVALAREGYYDGTIFHRVIEGFMVQGGDPTGTGGGGPGYRFADEIVPTLVFDRVGLLAMANSGQPVTNGSQFFITFAPTPWLNGLHTIFGQVVEGSAVVDAISVVSTDARDRPVKEVVIESIVILETTTYP